MSRLRSIAVSIPFWLAAPTAIHAASAVALPSPPVLLVAGHGVPSCATPARLMAYLRARNPALDDRYRDIAAIYERRGAALGVRWDYAFFQMMVHTGHLSFHRPDGSPGIVRSRQNNLVGLGASSAGEPGESFADLAAGVTAHLQHVLVHAGARVEAPLAERTRRLQAAGQIANAQRTQAAPLTYAALARKWATGDSAYGAAIESLARRFYESCPRGEAAGARALIVPAPVEVIRGGLPHEAEAAERADGAPAPADPSASRSARTEASPPAPDRRPPPSERPARVAVPHAPHAPPPPADPVADAIRKLVSDRTFLLDAAFGTTVPIVFRSNGTMQGKAGSLSGWLGSPTDSGRWWIERGRLCQRWSIWLERETQCLRLHQVGGIVQWVRDDGRSGTARIVAH